MSIQSQSIESTNFSISVRPLELQDLSAADQIMRVAFGTFLRLPDPASFMGDAECVLTRWRADPSAAFGAWFNDELVGSNFAAHWGSLGVFGPLTVRPDLWDKGVGKHLVKAVTDAFDAWGTRFNGLFTFAESKKHVGLYQKFGFYPRFLTMVMSKPVTPERKVEWTAFSTLRENERDTMLAACRQVTNAIYDGLDVGIEIRAVAEQNLGETVLLCNHGELAAFAVCHCGAGTEAGSGVCYVKFGAVRPGPTAADNFVRLLDACSQMAAEKDLSQVTAGVNTARHEAYRQMLGYGFRTDFQGIAMQRGSEPGYNRPGVYLLDDWR